MDNDMNAAPAGDMGDEEMVKCACGQSAKKGADWDAHAAMGPEHVPAPADDMPA